MDALETIYFIAKKQLDAMLKQQKRINAGKWWIIKYFPYTIEFSPFVTMLFVIITSKNKGNYGSDTSCNKVYGCCFFVVLAIVTFQDWWFIVAFGLAGGLSFTIGWLIYDEYKHRKENKRLAPSGKKEKTAL